ncbi:SLACS-associated protein, putative [Leishmania panamensis]|uniref:SLACS-associated protein, putative n=1 Tax=Leishmania panamensis TaxID=5679 RepID=A0AC62A6S3_LEIPA
MYPDTAEQEEEDTGSAPRSAEPRTETHTPPTQPPGTEGEGEENDTAESANTEPDQTVEDVSQTSDEARHRFHHGENTAAQQTGTIHCPVCPRTWTSRARRQQQTSHLNTTHAREVVRVDALKATGVDRCLSCGEFVIASGNARRAHGQKCGEFVTRAVRNQKRARTEQSTPRQDAVAEPTPETPPPPTRHRTRPTEADAEWVQEFPATIRTLRKQEWGHWAEAVGHTLLGYTAAAAAGRYQRQLALTELVRTRLAKPRAPAREEDESHQEEPSETPREGGRDEPYTGHAGATRRANTEEHLPTRDAHTAEERRARRILHQLSLGAVGKAARTLFQAQLPRARASEALDQLRTLHPQEDPAGYPCPPQTPFPHGLKPEKVRNVVLKRLGRAAAPGLDGWTRELLVPVVENAALLAETTALMQDILAGNVSASFAFRLRACVVHPFLKEPGSPKVRPITPESVWLKIASHLALDAVEKPFRDIFQGWQFGVWGDAAEAVTQIRETYASESADTLVALDATNAYNRVSRAWVLRAAYRHHALHHTVGVVDLSLGEPGALGVYEGGRRVEQLWSTRGVRQGMVLSPSLRHRRGGDTAADHGGTPARQSDGVSRRPDRRRSTGGGPGVPGRGGASARGHRLRHQSGEKPPPVEERGAGTGVGRRGGGAAGARRGAHPRRRFPRQRRTGGRVGVGENPPVRGVLHRPWRGRAPTTRAHEPPACVGAAAPDLSTADPQHRRATRQRGMVRRPRPPHAVGPRGRRADRRRGRTPCQAPPCHGRMRAAVAAGYLALRGAKRRPERRAEGTHAPTGPTQPRGPQNTPPGACPRDREGQHGARCHARARRPSASPGRLPLRGPRPPAAPPTGSPSRGAVRMRGGRGQRARERMPVGPRGPADPAPQPRPYGHRGVGQTTRVRSGRGAPGEQHERRTARPEHRRGGRDLRHGRGDHVPRPSPQRPAEPPSAGTRREEAEVGRLGGRNRHHVCTGVARVDRGPPQGELPVAAGRRGLRQLPVLHANRL